MKSCTKDAAPKGLMTVLLCDPNKASHVLCNIVCLYKLDKVINGG